MKRFLLSTFALIALPAMLGILVNSVRPDALPLVAERPYEILVPCPMERVEVEPVTAAEAALEQVLFIDARPRDDYEKSHISGALSLPYDDLAEPSAAELAPIRQARAARIVVYGTLDHNFDLGHQQASDLAAAGLPRVYYLEGGFEAWRATGRPVEPAAQPAETIQKSIDSKRDQTN